MKKSLILLTLFITSFVFAQDDDAIIGQEEINSVRLNRGVQGDFSFDYRATVKYKMVVFGGVKLNVNVTDLTIHGLTYKGESISDSVYQSLNIYTSNNVMNPIEIKKGLYDVTTDIEFTYGFCDYLDYSCRETFRDVKIVAVGWGSLDEYTYLSDENVAKLKTDFNIKKADDFYQLDAHLKKTKITNFSINILRDIQTEMDKLRNKEALIAEKIKALKALEHNKKLTVEKLKYKKKLIEELLALDIEDCGLFPTSCNTNLKMVEAELKIKLLASTIKELKTLTPNKSLTLEKLKQKQKLIEELINADVKDCMSANSCSSDLKNVENEIEKRFDIKGMTRKQTFEWIKNFIINNNDSSKCKNIREIHENYNNIVFYSCDASGNSPKTKYRHQILIPFKNFDLLIDENRNIISKNNLINVWRTEHYIRDYSYFLRKQSQAFYFSQKIKEDELNRFLKALKHFHSFGEKY